MIILVRHGQTAVNAGGRLQGRTDAPLTGLGRRQAAAAAAAVAAGAASEDRLRRPMRVIASPLIRARETAAAFGVDVEVDERWIELDYGEWEGRPVASVPLQEWDRWRADPGFAPPDGESLETLAQRVGDACADLAAAAAAGDGDIVVVSHVSPIKGAVGWALGVGTETFWRTFLDVASISRISAGARGPALVSFNETAHLAALASGAVTTTTTISVPSIHCDNCKNSIEGALRGLAGVSAADVSVPDKTVTVAFDDASVDLDAIREAIEEQGFDLD